MKGKIVFANLILFCLAVISFFPQFRALPLFNILWVVLMMVWLGSAISLARGAVFNGSGYRFFILIFVLYTVGVPYIFGNGVIGNRFLELSQIYLFFLAYQINDRYGYRVYSIRILYCLLPFVLITCTATISALLKNPFASRQILERGGV